MKKKILLVLSLVLALVSVFSLVAYASEPVCTHVDANADNTCDLCEEIIQAKQKYLDAGYDIVDEQSYRTFDGITPIDTKPVVTRIKISWKEN
jgi:tRNA U54 and U55 pseudouridine synthase Pus10